MGQKTNLDKICLDTSFHPSGALVKTGRLGCHRPHFYIEVTKALCYGSSSLLVDIGQPPCNENT